MNLFTPDPPELQNRGSGSSSRHTERVIALATIGLVLSYALWTLRESDHQRGQSMAIESVPTIVLSPEMIPLTTGEEPITDIFIRAGCPVCHTIPGIPGANGRVGPPLILGTTGTQRLSDSSYDGNTTTVHDYIVESVLDPERFIVPGYPNRTMPTWYGSKLSGLALEKIAAYLEKQTGAHPTESGRSD